MASDEPAVAYPVVLFDFDHMLFDTAASEQLAFAATMHRAGIADPSGHFDRYNALNQALWRRVETGEISPNDLRVERFVQFLAGLDPSVRPQATAEQMANQFVESFGASGDLYPGARDLLDALRPHCRLGLLTNGLSQVQRARIERLDLGSFFEVVVISGEVGVAKPEARFFELAFEMFEAVDGPIDRASVLMVGDSLASDMQGGHNVGVDTAWFNPDQSPCPNPDLVTHEFANLASLIDLVLA